MANGNDLNQSAEDFSSKMEEISFQFKYVLNAVNSLAKQTGLAREKLEGFRDVSKEITKNLNENKDVLKKVVEGEMTAAEVAKARAKQQELLKKYNSKRASIEKQLSNLSGKGNKKKREALKQEMALLNKKSKNQIKELKTAEELAKKGNNNISKGLEGMSKTFGKMGFTNFAKSMKGASASLRKSKIATGGLLSGFTKMSGVTGKLAKMNPFGAMLGVIVGIFKMIGKVNQEVTILGRNLGISGKMASRVRQHFVNVAAEISRFGVTYEEVSIAAAALNKQLGMSVRFLKTEIIGDMAVLMKRTKLSAEAAVGFAQAALAGSKSVKDLAQDAAQGALNTEREFGARVDIRSVLEETGQTTGRLRALFGNNLELMGQTVSKAKMLGLTMKDVASQSAQMLDFHTSIEKEITAELFLNKSLNLERARLAALTGDLDTFMGEIRKNAGDFFEFSQMNVLQQNALAQALGMNVDTLADMLLKEENLLELKERARREGKESLLQNLEQLSVQEAFNEAIRMLKNIVINMVANLEKFELRGWMSKLLVGDRSLKGLKLTDLVNREETEKSIMKLSSVNRDDSIYGDNLTLGSSTIPGAIALQAPTATAAPTAVDQAASPVNVNVEAKLSTNKFDTNIQGAHTKFDSNNSGFNYGTKY